jgi:hypothetical protein
VLTNVKSVAASDAVFCGSSTFVGGLVVSMIH